MVRANGIELPPASGWIAGEPLELEVEEGGELLIAYEGSTVRSGT